MHRLQSVNYLTLTLSTARASQFIGGRLQNSVYQALIEQRQGNAESLSQSLRCSYADVADALDVLVGTGVIQKMDDELHAIGAQLFEDWVTQQQPKIQP